MSARKLLGLLLVFVVLLSGAAACMPVATPTPSPMEQLATAVAFIQTATAQAMPTATPTATASPTLAPTREPTAAATPTSTTIPTTPAAPEGEGTNTATPTTTPTVQPPVEPSKARVRKMDGSEIVLEAPLSIQGDLEAGCGWRFLALTTVNIREIRRLADTRYALVGYEGEMIISPGQSAATGRSEWGYERLPIAETDSIQFEGGSPGTPPTAARQWDVTDGCGQQIRLVCPDAGDWTTPYCLPDPVSAQYAEFKLSLQPAALASLARTEGTDQFKLRFADGSELDSVTFAGDVALTGQTWVGRVALPLAQAHSLTVIPAPTPTAGATSTWDIISLSGRSLAAKEARGSDDRLSAVLGDFNLTLDLSQLQSLRRDPPSSASFRLLDAAGNSLDGLVMKVGQEIQGSTGFGGYALAITDTLGVRLLNPLPPNPVPTPIWRLADTYGNTLEVSMLSFSGGTLPGYDVKVSSSFDKVGAIKPTQAGLSLLLPLPFGATEVISGTLYGGLGSGKSIFSITAGKTTAVDRLQAAELVTVTTVGLMRLSGGQELPASFPPSFPAESVDDGLVEYEFTWEHLSGRGFSTSQGQASLPCTASSVCPSGEAWEDDRDDKIDGGRAVEWEYSGALTLAAPWSEIEGYVPSQPPPLAPFTPTVAITVTGWQTQTATFLVRDVRFMQTERLRGGWVCIGACTYNSKSTYPSMSAIGITDGVTRTVEVDALVGIEFDNSYEEDSEPSLAMRLISRQGRILDVRLDPEGPPDNTHYYWDRSREGLIADAGDSVSVIIPFARVKRIDMGWLEYGQPD